MLSGPGWQWVWGARGWESVCWTEYWEAQLMVSIGTSLISMYAYRKICVVDVSGDILQWCMSNSNLKLGPDYLANCHVRRSFQERVFWTLVVHHFSNIVVCVIAKWTHIWSVIWKASAMRSCIWQVIRKGHRYKRFARKIEISARFQWDIIFDCSLIIPLKIPESTQWVFLCVCGYPTCPRYLRSVFCALFRI